MTPDPETRSILDQATEAAKRGGALTGKVDAEGRAVTGEVALEARGPSWLAKVFGRAKAEPGAKTSWSAGGEFSKRWLVAPPRASWVETAIDVVLNTAAVALGLVAGAIVAFVGVVLWLIFGGSGR